MNALKHGMTARLALLPDEDPAAFDRRMFEWVEEFRPRSDREHFHAERAVYCSWQLQRTQRARSARLVFKANTALDEQRNREEKEAIELALQLFRMPGGVRSGSDHTQPEAQERGQPGLSGLETLNDANHPALLVLGLESSEVGCRWLLDRWNELSAVIDDEGLAWQAPERFKAIRLLRMDTRDLLHAPAITAILQACQMLDPQAGELVNEFWNELLAANAGWSMERLRAWVPEMSLPADLAAARQELAEIVQAETERLEAKLKEHEEVAELEARYSGHQLAFDHSPEGERMRRYETTCQRYVDRFFNELDKRKSNKAGNRYEPASVEYTRPRPQAFRQTEGPSDSTERADLTALIDSIRKRDRESRLAAAEAKPSAAAMPAVECRPTEPSVPPVRNEPKGAGASSSKSQISKLKVGEENGTYGDASRGLRNEPKGAGASSSKSQILNPKGGNEPKGAIGPNSSQDETKLVVTPEQKVAAGRGTGRILRNEPKPARGAGTHRGTWQPKAWDNSRRARRAREAVERANGSRELDQALNFVGPGARNLLVPVS